MLCGQLSAVVLRVNMFVQAQAYKVLSYGGKGCQMQKFTKLAKEHIFEAPYVT